MCFSPCIKTCSSSPVSPLVQLQRYSMCQHVSYILHSTSACVELVSPALDSRSSVTVSVRFTSSVVRSGKSCSKQAGSYDGSRLVHVQIVTRVSECAPSAASNPKV